MQHGQKNKINLKGFVINTEYETAQSYFANESLKKHIYVKKSRLNIMMR